MKKIKHVSAAPSRPIEAESGKEGYFTNGTVVTATFLNTLQEELCAAVRQSNIDLDREDDAQLAKALSHTIAAPAGTGLSNVTNTLDTAVSVSENCSVSLHVPNSAVIASKNSYIASMSQRPELSLHGPSQVLLGCEGSTNSAQQGISIGCFETHNNCARSVLVSSRRCRLGVRAEGEMLPDDELTTRYRIGGGWGILPVNGAQGYDANINWWISSISGTAFFRGLVYCMNVVTDGSSGDLSEYFEVDEEIPFGTAVTLRGKKAVPANAGDSIDGIVVAVSSFTGGSAQVEWAGKYLYDDWGEKLGENPEFDPTLKYVPRASRKNEWCRAAIVGIARAKISDAVTTESVWLDAGENGVLVPSETKTNVKLMQILKDGVAQVFIR